MDLRVARCPRSKATREVLVELALPVDPVAMSLQCCSNELGAAKEVQFDGKLCQLRNVSISELVQKL